MNMAGAAVLAACLAPNLAACAEPPEQTTSPPDATVACAFERRATLPVEIRRNLPVVEAKINGETVHMIFDTGAQSSVVFENAAARLKLRPDGVRTSTLTGLSGKSVHANVIVDSFALGGIAFHNSSFTVTPTTIPNQARLFDGVVGLDLIRSFDADIDMPDRAITLYRGRDCPGGVPDWAFPWSTFIVTVAPETSRHVMVPALLDGAPVTVMVDTGADTPFVSTRAALKAGVPAAALASDRKVRADGIGPSSTTATLHRFASLILGPDQFLNQILPVVELPKAAGDMIVGSSWMRTRRFWLSMASRRLYLAKKI